MTIAAPITKKTPAPSPERTPAISSTVAKNSNSAFVPETITGCGPRFHYGFSQVRVHTDDKAAKPAKAVNAQADPTGAHSVFGAARGGPGDRCEQEADRVAADVMASPDGGTAPASAEAGAAADYRMNGGGQSLTESDRRFFEARLGASLGRVRVHADANAAEAAQAFSARAFTHGQNIYFGAGQFRPDGAEGRRLLAHELVHTVQQADISGGSEAHPVMRQPLQGETAAAAKQRHTMLDNAKTTIKELEQCMAKKLPCADETVAANGDYQKRSWGNNVIVESPAVRDARLNQLVADLKDIQHQLETAVVPAGATADIQLQQSGGRQIFSGYDLDNLYVRYALKQGRSYDLAVNNTLYIDNIVEKKKPAKPAPAKPKKKHAPSTPPKIPPPKTPADETKPANTEDTDPPRHFEEKTPFTIVVPDPQKAPLVYHILSSGFDDNRGYILDVFRDENGHFYRGPHDKKVYLPNWHDPY